MSGDHTLRLGISLSAVEIDALLDLLDEEAIRMDDDGNEGAFDRSPLRSVYDLVKLAEREMSRLSASLRRARP